MVDRCQEDLNSFPLEELEETTGVEKKQQQSTFYNEVDSIQ